MLSGKLTEITQITQLLRQHQLLVESNKKYMSTLIDIALLLARQSLALRVHDESSNSLNQGKLLQLLVTLLFIIKLIFKK